MARNRHQSAQQTHPLTEDLDVRSEFTGVYETILDPPNRLHAEFWQRTAQLHPDINTPTSTSSQTKQPRPRRSNPAPR